MAKQGEASLIGKGTMSSEEHDRAEASTGALPAKRLAAVRIGRFACEAIAAEEERAIDERIPLRAVQAIRCYLNDRDLGRPGWRYPALLREDWGRGEKVELELKVDRELWRLLEEEAERQEVSAEQLVEHAAFYFAAELNAGRVTRRILDELSPAPDS